MRRTESVPGFPYGGIHAELPDPKLTIFIDHKKAAFAARWNSVFQPSPRWQSFCEFGQESLDFFGGGGVRGKK